MTKSETTNGSAGKVTVPGKPPIQIRETSNGVIQLAGSTEVSVSTLKEMAACLEQGSLSRATGSTNMNNQSRLTLCSLTKKFQCCVIIDFFKHCHIRKGLHLILGLFDL